MRIMPCRSTSQKIDNVEVLQSVPTKDSQSNSTKEIKKSNQKKSKSIPVIKSGNHDEEVKNTSLLEEVLKEQIALED